MNETLPIIGLVLAAWAAQSILAFWLLLKITHQHHKRHGWTLTNGDVVFNGFIAFMPVSLLLAIVLSAVEGFGPRTTAWVKRKSPLDR